MAQAIPRWVSWVVDQPDQPDLNWRGKTLSYQHAWASRLRGQILRAIKREKPHELLGCTIEHARQHLERQFAPGMTWDNMGKWHIDHIQPCSSFDMSDVEQQRECFHYTNLQPLWGPDNLAKRNRLL